MVKITEVTRRHQSELMALVFIFIAITGLAVMLVGHDTDQFNAECMRDYYCVNECPVNAISLDAHGYPVINKSKCLSWVEEEKEFQWQLCGLCLRGCPTRVINLLNVNKEIRDKHTTD